MKKLLLLTITSAVLAAGCATADTANTAATSTATTQPITLDQALEKSVQARQQIETVKQQYQQVKTAAEVATGKKTAAQAAQEDVQRKLDQTKKQLQDEKDAWANLLK